MLLEGLRLRLGLEANDDAQDVRVVHRLGRGPMTDLLAANGWRQGSLIHIANVHR